jgi:hypothetical protein
MNRGNVKFPSAGADAARERAEWQEQWGKATAGKETIRRVQGAVQPSFTPDSLPLRL